VAALAGIWTLPVFGLAFIGQVVPLFFIRRDDRRRILATTGAVILGSLVLYSGVLGDLLASTDQEFGIRLPWHGVVTAPLEFFGVPIVSFLMTGSDNVTPDAALPAALLVGALVAIGAVGLRLRGNSSVALLLVSPVLVAFLLLTLGRLFVADRFVSYLALPLLVLGACGVTEAGRQLVRLRVPGPLVAAPAVLLALFSLYALGGYTAKVVSVVPKENFKEASEIAEGAGIERVVTNSSVRIRSVLYYFGGRKQVADMTSEQLRSVFCAKGRPFVFLQDPYKSIPADTRCLVARGATPVEVSQRRLGPLILWIVPR